MAIKYQLAHHEQTQKRVFCPVAINAVPVQIRKGFLTVGHARHRVIHAGLSQRYLKKKRVAFVVFSKEYSTASTHKSSRQGIGHL